MEITPNSSLPVNDQQPATPSTPTHQRQPLMHVTFPAFKHEKRVLPIDVNQVIDEKITAGARIADAVAATVGSWRFIIIQSIILILWLILNSILPSKWDPYPFILLNLALSFQAAYSAPFVMMSQNRQATKDRLTAENDYKTDTKGELEITHIMDHLDHQDHLILQVVERLEAQHKQLLEERRELIDRLKELVPENAKTALEESES
ncbi:membrane protein [Ktedonobacteria bacterium brp13]|nr:membrane protein [Ktedonobacteria bacterium brp13]